MENSLASSNGASNAVMLASGPISSWQGSSAATSTAKVFASWAPQPSPALLTLSAEEAAFLALVEVRSARNGAVVLICRRDPLVLEI